MSTTTKRIRQHPELEVIRVAFKEEPTNISFAILKKLRGYYKLTDSDLILLRTIRGVAAAMPELSWDRGKKGRTHSFICSMMNAGYQCTHPAVGSTRGSRTSLASVLVWLHEHPTFRSHHWSTANVIKRMEAKTLQPLKREPFQ